MHKHQRGPGCGLEVLAQPIEFRLRHVGIGPVEVVPFVGHAVAAKARVQDDEVELVQIERIVGACLPDDVQKLRLGQRRDAMVSQHTMARPGSFRKLGLDPLQEPLFRFQRYPPSR